MVMTMKKIIATIILVVMLSLAVAGCGGSGVSEDKPISEVRTEAQSLNVDQLKAMVAKYEKVIESKKSEIEAITAQLKKIPLTQMMGEEAGKLKGDISDITASVKALTDRLNIYAQEIKSKM